ncbi:MAG: transcriptional regulator SpxA [Carnobacterium inhibens]|uniref:Transcriptional regulator Spx n=1 Tax=Carnobacterium inhibens TaxID=147709 RepID=A0ABR7T9U2_9LACT|nr:MULTISPECIES: transcriptional regulator SpxA [Carnobacterium]MBC9824290.1 transcriptional regulator Spx [Carnobacterium inhibens]MCM3511612.1 transcriptional regulator SpxA [Carnobacterium inhibens]MDN5371284.1 regulatory protein spx [Carnobacterium sp.]
MITLYSSASCTSCRKAKSWLEEHDIPFTEKNVFTEKITDEELKSILQLTENGTKEIISQRSQAFRELDIDIEDMSLGKVLKLIQRHPGIMRRPILVDDKRLLVGYNEEDIRCFLPRDIRKLELLKLHDQLPINF